MKQDRRTLLLYEPNLYKAFLTLALPVFGANFMKAFNELVDTFFIGQTANSVAAQAGVSLSWPLINIFASFQVGFGVAGVAVVSQLLGAGRKEEARENAGVLLMVAVLFGVVLNVLLYLSAPWVMAITGASGDVLHCSVSYLRVRSFELVFTFVFAAFQAVRQAQGDTVTPVTLSVSAVVLNIVLTAVFVQGMGLGVFGAGLATVLGNVAVAPVCLYLLFARRQPLCLELGRITLSWPILCRLTRIAAPAAFSQALSSLGFLVLQAVILSYGEAVTAAFSIGNKISNILLMPVLALGSVLAAYVGQNIGAGNGDRARQAYRVSRNIGLAIAVAGSLLLLPFREELVALLSNDSATQTAAVEYMFWVLLTQPLMSLFQNYLGVFNGSGRTIYAFWMSTARLWLVRLPLITLFKQFTEVGSAGVWYAMVLSNFIILFLGAFLYRRVDFTPLRMEIEGQGQQTI
ncbi:MATE family efflux transporter [Intestinimonas sp.]|uniref:MATE family efflux transporter n=1 Tax=Intestinimonas sp. TaxID=1965293 RepID=UPI0026082F97|nr:MATE family efflux transporter [Intestinimonas sp.]